MDEIKRFDKGSFNDYVDQILPFFDHHLPIVDKRRHVRYPLPFVPVDNSKIIPPPFHITPNSDARRWKNLGGQ